MSKDTMTQLKDIARRIRGMREVMGYSEQMMADKTELSLEEYVRYEVGETDFPFTFIHSCAQIFGIDMEELIEGKSARLSSYNVTRAGYGSETAKEDGIIIKSLAPKFRNKTSEPYWVRYEYQEKLQDQPIHLIRHGGQEFDLIISGALKVQVGDHQEVLHEGDSIYYNSSSPHGMIAVEGQDCTFIAVVIPGEDIHDSKVHEQVLKSRKNTHLLCEKFIKTTEDANGVVDSISFKDEDKFNFAFDIIDELGKKYPEKTAMIHLDSNKKERKYTFEDIKKESGRAANYFTQLGIKKGDKVLLMMRRAYQFWFAILGLHKIGAVAIPAPFQLKAHDLEYRFNAAEVKAVICDNFGDVPENIETALQNSPSVEHKIICNGKRDGWHDFDSEYNIYSSHFSRTEDTACGEDTSIIFFSSGTSGQPKMVEHKHTYALGHFLTARYWHCCEPDGLHFTISDTGWGKSFWGKLYGQWLCEGSIFVYDFDRFNAKEILPLFKEYNITTFCAPPTMLRMFAKEDLSQYDYSSLRHITTAGEALNPETARVIQDATGLEVMEGFGQTETTLACGNFAGMPIKTGSMGKASPQFKLELLDNEGRPVENGETGEIVIDIRDKRPIGLCKGYYKDEERTNEAFKNGFYHTGDTAWRDEDGYFWYVGRADDIIKSSGYRIGPFEIESVIMELPYVVECGVSAAPDEVRGQIVKASIVLTDGTEPSEELVAEIQEYVKKNTAPYKYPRIVVFKDELPRTTNGKIKRSAL